MSMSGDKLKLVSVGTLLVNKSLTNDEKIELLNLFLKEEIIEAIKMGYGNDG